MENQKTKKMVEAGVMIALSFLLSQIKLFKAPQGGSVTAGSMIPIILFSLRWGWKPGILAGATFGILKMLLGGYIVSPVQAILEYPLAFGLLGLSGIFSDALKNAQEGYFGKILGATFLAIIGRFICHVVAGVVFFGENFPTLSSSLRNSLVYNSSYLIPEFIISGIILFLIWKPINKADI